MPESAMPKSSPSKKGQWIRAGLLAMGLVGCTSSPPAYDPKAGPSERSLHLVARTAAATRVNTDKGLFAFDVLYNPQTKQAVLSPSIFGWTPAGWKGGGLNYNISEDLNTPNSRRIMAGVAQSLFNGLFRMGVRAIHTENGTNALLAGRLSLPHDTNFFYSFDPKLGPISRQIGLSKSFVYKGTVTTLTFRGEGDRLKPTVGAEYAWGNQAARFAINAQKQAFEFEFLQGLGNGNSQLSLFTSIGRKGEKAIGVGVQIPLGKSASAKEQLPHGGLTPAQMDARNQENAERARFLLQLRAEQMRAKKIQSPPKRDNYRYTHGRRR